MLLAGQAAVADDSPGKSPTLSPADLGQQIHSLINRERRKHNLKVLAWDERLVVVALTHSRDMLERNYLSHNDLEGRDFVSRYRRHKYDCRVTIGHVIYTGAENIAFQRRYSSVVFRNGVPRYRWNSTEDVARTTVEGWMESPGHRKNILTPHWRREGIGVAISGDNRILITQNFC